MNKNFAYQKKKWKKFSFLDLSSYTRQNAGPSYRMDNNNNIDTVLKVLTNYTHQVGWRKETPKTPFNVPSG